MSGDEIDERIQDSPALAELRRRVWKLEQQVAELQGTAPMTARPELPPRASAIQPLRTKTIDELAVPSFAHAPPAASLSMEDRLGAQWFSRIGIATLLMATALFLKLSIDRHWIGPVGRILVGLVAGAGLVVWSERFRRQGVTAFSYALKAIGTGVLYLTLWAAFQLYHLLPSSVALGAMVLVTAWNAFMAWAQASELLAGYALAGGLATPLLLSTGGNHEVFLFTYLLAIDLATVLLARLRRWPKLLLATFPATVVYFFAWYGSHFAASELGVTALFLILFGGAFVCGSVELPRTPCIPRERSLDNTVHEILLPLCNAAFLALGLYLVLERSGHHAWQPWLMLALAGAYLAVVRLRQGATAAALHLSLAVVFLTIAIPLKASGRWITVAWLAEGVALFWASTRLTIGSEATVEPSVEPSPARVVRLLALGSLALGFVSVLASSFWAGWSSDAAFFNRDFATALVAVACFALVGWLSFRPETDLPATLGAFAAVEVLAALMAVREVATHRFDSLRHDAFADADFGMALVGAAVLGLTAWGMARRHRAAPEAPGWTELASAAVVAFNLVVVLSFTREIGSLWLRATETAAGLQRALAGSAFLMFYSALLLAAGFWKRSAFLRWQGLALLVFTVGKTFLYDTSSLSQEYRVASFLALGVLLMGVSFAYQKDWLGLRVAEGSTPPPETP